MNEVLEAGAVRPLAELQQGAIAPEAPVNLPAVTPDALLALAAQRGATIDQMERMMVVAKQLMEMASADRKERSVQAFNKAFADFKACAIRVVKDKQVTDGPLKGKFHATTDGAVTASTEALSKYGLSTSWKLTKDEPGWIEITCMLKHADGHSESVSMGGEPDTGPGRNKMQARASTKTYLERYTLLAILGLAAGDADDDGAGGAPANVQAGQLGDTWVLKARDAQTLDALNATWNAGLAPINAAKDRDAYDRFKAAVVKRQKELAS